MYNNFFTGEFVKLDRLLRKSAWPGLELKTKQEMVPQHGKNYLLII